MIKPVQVFEGTGQEHRPEPVFVVLRTIKNDQEYHGGRISQEDFDRLKSWCGEPVTGIDVIWHDYEGRAFKLEGALIREEKNGIGDTFYMVTVIQFPYNQELPVDNK